MYKIWWRNNNWGWRSYMTSVAAPRICCRLEAWGYSSCYKRNTWISDRTVGGLGELWDRCRKQVLTRKLKKTMSLILLHRCWYLLENRVVFPETHLSFEEVCDQVYIFLQLAPTCMCHSEPRHTCDANALFLCRFIQLYIEAFAPVDNFSWKSKINWEFPDLFDVNKYETDKQFLLSHLETLGTLGMFL